MVEKKKKQENDLKKTLFEQNSANNKAVFKAISADDYIK